ncbi:aldo/keto reductase [Labilibacter sediminis]|nr:aldo/keto reductase [Labilibacter sediminis]
MSKQKDSRRLFLKKALTASAGTAIVPAMLKAEEGLSDSYQKKELKPAEWRNKQAGMAYRMFGNTGMMVSEMVQGTALWSDESFLRVFDIAFEKGVNYIDTAPAYKKGAAEKLVGQYLKQSGNRQNIFLSNKISFYDEYMLKQAMDIYKGLPTVKQEQLRVRANKMVEDRGVLKPGYHFDYWKGQTNKLYDTYLRYLVVKEYCQMQKWKPGIKKRMYQLVENSLQAAQTDYFDVLHCPHGVAMPEMLEDENIREVLDDLKRKGVIRFSALSMHNDVAGNLEKAIELGYYDATMIAYNIGNHASLDRMILKAKEVGMGIVAMKVAKIIHNEDTPQWRIDKLHTAIEGNLSKYGKAYLWALQNPNISCCVSDMITKEMVDENTSVVGTRVEIGEV